MDTSSGDALIAAVKGGTLLPDLRPQFQRFLGGAVDVFNEEHSPRSLVRLGDEVIPSHPQDITAVRGRMGTLMELGLAAVWNLSIKDGAYPDWRVAVNYVTEYPNLYLRDENGVVRLRIETKALHDEADEGAARFDTLTPQINQFLDVLIVVGWRWRQISKGKKMLVYPYIFASDAFSAIEIAQERDTRFRIVEGVFRAGGRPFVKSKRPGRPFVADPGNYGKLNRIVHPTRLRKPEQLSQDVQEFVGLLKTIFPRGRGARRGD